MPVIVVANPKGGVGKSTLSTQIAGYFASRGHAVMLGDVDPQQSSKTWLAIRPEAAKPIRSWDVSHDHIVKPPAGTTHVVLDTPAGLQGWRLDAVMRIADKVLIPLQPSIFDIHATHDFVAQLEKHQQNGKPQLGLIGMRTKEGTIAADQLKNFLGTLPLPVIGGLRDTQNYVHLAARGLTLWDVAPSRVARDLEQWAPILKWLQSA